MQCTHKIDEHNCDRPSYKNLNKCVLHCGQDSIAKKNVDRYLKEFYETFEKFIELEFISKFQSTQPDLDQEQEVIEDNITKNYISEYDNFFNDSYINSPSADFIKKLNSISLKIEGLVFPKSTLDSFQYNKFHYLFSKLWNIKFYECEFHSFSFDSGVNSQYISCIFHNKVRMIPLLKDLKEGAYRYTYCDFKKDVVIESSGEAKEIASNIFQECLFKEGIELKNLNFTKTVFSFPRLEDSSRDGNTEYLLRYDEERLYIKSLVINNCIFSKDFKLNGFNKEYIDKIRKENLDYNPEYLTITNLEIKDTKFESKFEMKNRIIKNICFSNSNVNGIFDAFESEIEKAYFYKSIFEDFAGFEKVHFGIKDNYEKDYIAEFVYTTFMSFSNFRETVFNSGLDLERINLKENPNFLKADVSQKNTKRESFRIIKHSFDSIGNQIEANKFFVKEMKAYKKELDDIKSKNNCLIERLKKSKILKKLIKIIEFSESKRARLVFNINYCISEFGENYFKPILILIFSLLIYTLFNYAHTWYFKNFEYFIHPWFDCVSVFLNDLANNFLPFSGFLKGKSGMEFISLFFYIWFAILVWQIIVAIKRHTQR